MLNDAHTTNYCMQGPSICIADLACNTADPEGEGAHM